MRINISLLKAYSVGDISGQIIILEIPKLFSKIVSNEKKKYYKKFKIKKLVDEQNVKK